MPRLFWKLFFALWLSIMGFAVIMAMVNSKLHEFDVPQEPVARFNRDIDVLEQRLSRVLQAQGLQGAKRALQELPRQLRNHVYLIDENGVEVLGRDRIRKALRSRDPQRQVRTLVDKQNTKYQLIVLRRPPPGALLEPGKRGVALRLMIAAFVSAMVSFFIARYLASPLVFLSRASRRLAGGDLSTRIGQPLTARKDEFGRLAADFDEMASRLQDLQQANRRLLRDVSHELRSPLARLRVALEIARNRDHVAVAGELDRIELESERLEALVDEVLVLLRESSETHPLKREEFDLTELLGDLRDMAGYEVPEGGGEIRLSATAPLRVNADRELIWRGLENLVRNAVLHSGGGDVDIIAHVAEAGGTVEIHVCDSGPGVPSQHLDKLFEPFYRVEEARDRRSGGHGLGLAIALAAIRRHGGNIEAHNRETGGLEMIVTLPVKA